MLPKLEKMDEIFAVCRLPAESAIPAWSLSGRFFSISKSSDEVSIVCESKQVPNDVQQESPWRAFRVIGPLDFSLTGILASIAKPLAEAKISIFAISTFDTDYILVRSENFDRAFTTLLTAGFKF